LPKIGKIEPNTVSVSTLLNKYLAIASLVSMRIVFRQERSDGGQLERRLPAHCSLSCMSIDIVLARKSYGSFQREGQTNMSSERTAKEIEQLIAEDEARLAKMTDADIDYSDIPPVRDFSGWERGKFYRPVKDQVTLRLDRYMLDWFRHNHEKYQTAINAALREHMDRHRKTL